MQSLIQTGIILRQAEPEDGDFLFSVYTSTRYEEMAMLPWSEAEKINFIKSQFQAQDAYYKQNYPGAEFQVILLDGQPIGRLYVHRMKDEIHVMDISLLPEHRGQGIGTHLLNGILEEGIERNLPVTIYVKRFNPAMHFYERLGFRQVSDDGVYLFMKWLPMWKQQHETIGSITKQ